MRSGVIDGFLVRGNVIDTDVEAIPRELDGYASATACLIRPLILREREDEFAYIPCVDPVTMTLPRLDRSSPAISSKSSVCIMGEEDEFACRPAILHLYRVLERRRSVGMTYLSIAQPQKQSISNSSQ